MICIDNNQGFTALAFLKLAVQAKRILPEHDFLSDVSGTCPLPVCSEMLSQSDAVLQDAGEAWYAVSLFSALMLLGFAIALLLMAALPYLFKVHWNL